ncbi:MAG: glycosyltransferase family 39 protein [Bacteroidales bacterium]|nr:glycosyltransferase family 39 protein [Lentimicrobiaceae bacterium]MDD5695863.1 glycosyltransferase family 39 protein [Bacteroidales bacterium]
MRNYVFFGLLCLLLFISLFFWQDVVELLGEEPRRAVVSLEMNLTGDYLVPKINGMNYYNKPPLFNWIMASCFTLTGSYEEWVVRLPSLLGWIVLAIVNYFFVRRFLGSEVAMLSSIFTLTAGDVYFYGTIFSGEIDLFYSLIIYLQILALFWFFQKDKRLWMFIVSYALVAIGFLTKGLPSLAFQAMTLLGMAFFYRKWKWLFSWQHLAGALFFLLPVGLYYIAYSREADYQSYLINLIKEASQRSGFESRPSDFFISLVSFPADLIKLLLPWSVLIVFWFRKGFKSVILSSDLLRFVAAFLVFNIPLYWLTGELRNRYVYMFVPFFMMIIASFYVNYRESMPQIARWADTIFRILIILAPLIFLIPLFLPQTRTLHLYWLKCMVLAIAGFICTYLYFIRWKDKRIYLIVLVMILLRFGINWFYLPAYQSNDAYVYYEKVAGDIVSLTGDEKIHFTGEPQILEPQVRIGKHHLTTLHFTYPEYIPFQLSYYLERQNKQVLEFTSLPQPGTYCLGRESFLKGKAFQELYRYSDKRAKADILLVRMLP